MCGIAGIVNYHLSEDILRLQSNLLQEKLLHRGPDGSGTITFPFMSMAHTRLALLDLCNGSQPLVSADRRYSITYNGEIYNYKEIRSQLSGIWEFKTNTDTEVVLAAFSHWGDKCLNKFNGMFSFFIWDSKENTGFAARDLLGIKPLAYKYSNGEFVFASEVKAIVSLSDSPNYIDKEAVIEYLIAPYFSGVETSMFSDIEYLQPGHYIKVERDRISIRQWKDYSLSDALVSDASGIDEMAFAVDRAVSSSLVADVPICTYLSGGFDSTLITALAKKHSSHELESFTIRFADQDKYNYGKSLIVNSDDTPYAVDAAKDIGVLHDIVNVNRADIRDAIKQIAVNNDALPAWEQEFAQHFLAKVAALKYKAVIVGDAADETHYGYQFLLDELATNSPAGIINRFQYLGLRKGLLDNPLGYFNDKYKSFAERAGHCWNTKIDRYLATTYLIIKRWLPRLLHNGDIHSMSFSLEARVPFADIDLLDISRKVHPELGFNNGTEKWFLRRSVKGMMPEKSRIRKKSALPKDQGVSDIYKEMGTEVIKKDGDLFSYFVDIDYMNKLCESGVVISEQERSFLFRSISLAYWIDEYGVDLN